MIAECAERIIAILNEKREVNILHVCELLSERNVIAYQALGWLAREGRVDYRSHGSQVFITLRGAAVDG
jgi:hypothetical protein